MKFVRHPLAIALASCVALSSCGGDSSSNKNKDGNNPPAGTSVLVTPSLGLVSNAALRALEPDNSTEIAVGETGDNGEALIDLGSYSGPVIYEVSGDDDAMYYDEVLMTQVPFPAGNVIRALSPTANDAAITPLTELAYQLAVNAGNFPLTAEIINELNEAVRAGLAPGLNNILSVPTLLGGASDPGSLADDEAGRYALILAALAYLAENDVNGSPALTTLQSLVADIADGDIDGEVDGTAVANSPYGDFASAMAAALADAASDYSFAGNPEAQEPADTDLDGDGGGAGDDGAGDDGADGGAGDDGADGSAGDDGADGGAGDGGADGGAGDDGADGGAGDDGADGGAGDDGADGGAGDDGADGSAGDDGADGGAGDDGADGGAGDDGADGGAGDDGADGGAGDDGADGGVSGGSALACGDLSIHDAIGTKYQFVFRSEDSESGIVLTTTSDTEVTQVTDFKGNQAVEARSEVIADASDDTYDSESVTFSYTNDADGGNTLLTYGVVTEAESSQFPGTITTTVSFDPAREQRFDLNPGESYTQTFTQTVETELPSFGGASIPGQDPVVSERTVTTTYQGRETITVPAGTFETCKFTDSDGGTQWLSVGDGLPVKTEADGDESVLISATINGQAATGN